MASALTPFLYQSDCNLSQSGEKPAIEGASSQDDVLALNAR